MHRRESLAAVAALLATPLALAQRSFPSAPVQFVVPANPGGIVDLVVRAFGRYMTEKLGQPVVTLNKSGGQQVIGGNYVAAAPPDGHTILMATSVMLAVNPHLLRSLPFDARVAFDPITLVGQSSALIAVPTSSPFKALPELLEAARGRPGELNYASAGVGTTGHLTGELLRQRAGLDYRHISYAGNANAMNAVLGGQVDFLIDNEPAIAAQVRGGRLRALAISTAQRSKGLPDVPSIAESGFSGFEMVGWLMACAPAGTPTPIIERLHDAIIYAMERPEAVQTINAAGGLALKSSTPEAARAYAASEFERFGSIIKAGNIRAE